MSILTREHLNELARADSVVKEEFTNEELQAAWDGLLTPYGKKIAAERDSEREAETRNHKMNRKKITLRTAERLVRAAYDYEQLAAVFRSEGHDSMAEGVQNVSRRLGDMGRSLERQLEGRDE